MLGNVRGGIVDPFHPTMTGSNASEPVDVDAQEPIVLVLARYPGGGGSTIESDPSLGQLLGQIRQVSEAFGGCRQREGSFSRDVEPAGDPLSHRPTSVGIGKLHRVRQMDQLHLLGPRSSDVRLLLEECLLQLIRCQNPHLAKVRDACDRKVQTDHLIASAGWKF